MVICSQVRAFLDLGFEVEFVYLHRGGPVPPPFFDDITLTVVQLPEKKKPTLAARLPYWLGWPKHLAWRPLFLHAIMRREVSARIAKDPGTLHVFNYLATAHIIPDLARVPSIWVCHDLEVDYQARNFAIDREREHRGQLPWERRLLRRMASVERETAHKAGLVLCLASDDARKINEQFSISSAAYLPMSVVAGPAVLAAEPRLPADNLRLLHLGDITHLPTLSSLQFLLTRVLPLLDAATLARLEIEVVGKLPESDPRVGMVMEMARPFPQVTFSGFVADLDAVYRRSHLQIVASQQATGIRTRIIESWAAGLPVLSTTVGTGGVEHIAAGENILVIDDPVEFANCLRDLVRDSRALAEISAAGRRTYEENFSRGAVADCLRGLLSTHFGYGLPALPGAALPGDERSALSA